MIKKMWDLLYPQRCPLCEQIVDNEERLCPECVDNVSFVHPPMCMKCGRPFDTEDWLCEDCKKCERAFDRGVSVFVYEGPIRAALHRFKYKNRRCYGAYFGREAARLCGAYVEQWSPQVILPVPIHRSRRRQRGYNQAELLAKQLSNRMGIPVDTKLLTRVKKTKALKTGAAWERREWLKNAFACRENPGYKTVLLVDDIYTTGTTVDVLAKLLKDRGIQQVYVLTMAIGVRG